jgi:uncharacterized membrane-anchored protein YhcB (DUF1043 family)
VHRNGTPKRTCVHSPTPERSDTAVAPSEPAASPAVIELLDRLCYEVGQLAQHTTTVVKEIREKSLDSSNTAIEFLGTTLKDFSRAMLEDQRASRMDFVQYLQAIKPPSPPISQGPHIIEIRQSEPQGALVMQALERISSQVSDHFMMSARCMEEVRASMPQAIEVRQPEPQSEMVIHALEQSSKQIAHHFATSAIETPYPRIVQLNDTVTEDGHNDNVSTTVVCRAGAARGEADEHDSSRKRPQTKPKVARAERPAESTSHQEGDRAESPGENPTRQARDVCSPFSQDIHRRRTHFCQSNCHYFIVMLLVMRSICPKPDRFG